MRVDCSKIGSGKTTRIVEWLRADPRDRDINGVPMTHTRCMIVFNESEKERILREYPDLKYQQVETWWTITNEAYGPVVQRMDFMIDNLDMILPQMFKSNIVGFSMTDTER